MSRKSQKGSPKEKDTEALVRLDSLTQYLQQLNHYPMLTSEEERDLANRYRDEGDLEAAKKLAVTHLRLVAKIAMEYRNASGNALDLIQEGNIGLLQAIKNFDPERGARLATYASWWIKSYILKYILDNFRLIKIGTTKTQKKLFYNLMKEKRKLEAMGYMATPVELSKKLGVAEKEVVEMHKRLTEPEYGLSAPVKAGNNDGQGSATLQDFIPNSDEPIDSRVSRSQSDDILKNKFEEFAATLGERDRRIFKERLLAELPLTLQVIADEFGITKERVRQLETKLISKLRESFEESGIDASVIEL
jgi:RNA polymerase sigma-32 factor